MVFETRISEVSILAKAKINLDLLITGKREDGYHLLDSLVVFADYGDEIILSPADELTLEVCGPFSKSLKADDNNLALKAARMMKEHFSYAGGAKITLIKKLPVSSGIGGGSADAAATIRGMMEIMNIEGHTSELESMALSLGADVPVCLQSQNIRMRGIGERFEPFDFDSPLHLLLVNPGVSVSTAEIFQKRSARKAPFSQDRALPEKVKNLSQIVEILSESANDLEQEACLAAPEIKTVLTALKSNENCLLARMSGSGATCFGLYEKRAEAEAIGHALQQAHPQWWVQSASAT